MEDNNNKYNYTKEGDKMELALEQRRAYSEVLEVLRHMEKQYVDKIPKKIIMYFYDNCQLDYDYTMTQSIDKEPLSDQALDLLALIDSSYWHKNKTKEEILMSIGTNRISQNLNNQLEKENEYTKIEINNDEQSDLPAPIQSATSGIKKVLHIIKTIIVKLFGD